MIPRYFLDLNAITPRGDLRWVDQFVTGTGDERKVLTPTEIRNKKVRNLAYNRWQKSFLVSHNIKVRENLWQAIRVHSFNHATPTRKDWWENFQDALFRVFVQPHTEFSGNDHRQWYILCPEDCELVNRYLLETKHNNTLSPRGLGEEYISKDKRLRMMRLIPVECCKHMRHETTAGVLPSEL